MAANKRSKAQVERDRVEIARLYLQGESQVDIAGKLGLTQPMVSYDLKAVRAEWLKSSLINYDQAKARELAKIDNLELVYWESWERSLKDFTSRIVKAKNSASQEEREEATKNALLTIKTEQRVGDPRFLEGIQWCINKRCQIFGLDAPTKINIGWQKEVLELLKSGAISEQDILDELGSDIAQEFFVEAGLNFAGIGPAEETSAEE